MTDEFSYATRAEPSPPTIPTSRPSGRSIPERIGRYRIVRSLGQGGFGQVFLGQDDELQRPVAIKVPHPERVARPQDAEAFLAEARILARLDHPGIVPVYDVGRTEDGFCYVVSKFLEGSDLAATIRSGPLPPARSAEVVAGVAEALHHAHMRGLVHRDVKPANILLDAAGKPLVADFGLALRDEDYGHGARLAGTPAYMSPEQAQGEGHRVDGRSDVFSLGVVFYELLTGRRPFRGDSQQELLEQIASAEFRPPRQLDDTIPKPLERICLKALSKRASDRYTTARDLGEDLCDYLSHAHESDRQAAVTTAQATPAPPTTQQATPAPVAAGRPESESRPIKVVPKGLRPFDVHDAPFFLELLPGPRDRDGLPESLRFWKTRIEERDADQTFRVGLLYGPSGCGKSSLLRAGLLPRLAEHVLTVHIEATPDETEARLLRGLHKRCPDLAPGLGLVESMAALRRGQAMGSSRKVLVILDQFEQWLHSRPAAGTDPVLVSALRQCDGGRVQAIVLIRDDFWMAATRFMRDLEVRIVDGENSAAVDLFDPRHARAVLRAFGRAFGALPEQLGQLTENQRAFLDRGIAGLAEGDKIMPVRLALFAEMLKGKAWEPATLRGIGGALGVGVTFLEETFAGPAAPPAHRLHQKAARAVLKALLPAGGTALKGHMKSSQDLLEASGYHGRPADFAELIRILDGELRLITPTDPEGTDDSEGSRHDPQGRYYQLTHDYLVPALREWLVRKQKETRRGRAELRLADRETLWTARPEDRHLPSAWEFGSIRLLTRKQDWTEPQRRMMRRAGLVHTRRGAVAAVLLLALGVSVAFVRRREKIERQVSESAALVQRLLDADTEQVPAIVAAMPPYRRWADPALRREVANASDHPRRKLHASLALLPMDPGQVEYLYTRLLGATPAEVQVIRAALEPKRAALVERLWNELEHPPSGAHDRCLQAAGALALYDPQSPRWDRASATVAEALIAVSPVSLGEWMDVLRPVRARLLDPLSMIFCDPRRPESERSLAIRILANYAEQEPAILADLLMDADAKSFLALFPEVRLAGPRALAPLEAELGAKTPKVADDADRDRLARRQANAAVALVRLGRPEQVWPLLRHSADPSLRSYIVNWLSPLGAPAQAITAELSRPKLAAAVVTAAEGPHMEAVLFHPETSERRALILALGQFPLERLPPREQETWLENLFAMYRRDPDAGIHGAAEWTLRAWGQDAKLKAIDRELSRLTDPAGRRWLVNRQGQTMAIVAGPVEFTMGSPPGEPGRIDADETQHRERIGHSFAITTKEVTIAAYAPFARAHPEHATNHGNEAQATPEFPELSVTWYDAAAYCNWLTLQEGLTEADCCYEPDPSGRFGEKMRIRPGALDLRGYRLPADAEWEYACRAGSLTPYYYGHSLDLLHHYAGYFKATYASIRPAGWLMPNDLGLFDMMGNAREWVQDRYTPSGQTSGATEGGELVTGDVPRILRGGSSYHDETSLRSAYRKHNPPSDEDNGFRVVRTWRP